MTGIIPSDPARLKRFILAGNAVFTMVSRKTGGRFTFKVQRAKPNPNYGPTWFVRVLPSPGSEDDGTLVGRISGVVFLRSHSTHSEAPKIFEWLLTAISSNWIALQQIDFFHQGKCCRCGRTLTLPESIINGVGPECADLIGE